MICTCKFSDRCVCGHPRGWHRETWANIGVEVNIMRMDCVEYRCAFCAEQEQERCAIERARLAREEFGDR